MEEVLKVKVSPEGRASVEVIGGQGSSCLEATREIERALGDVVNRQKKPEFHHVVTVEQQNLRRS